MGGPPPRPPASSRGISIDLRVPLAKVGRLVPGPVKRAAEAAKGPLDRVERIAERLDPFEPRSEHPGDGVIMGCSVRGRAPVVALADLPDRGSAPGGLPCCLLRLAVPRADGPVEVCVRQLVPHAVRAGIGPGTELPVLASRTERARAVVDWSQVVPGLTSGAWVRHQFAWPLPDEWPAPGRIEVRDGIRHRQRMEERRATWRSVWSRPVWISHERGLVDGRPRHDITLELAEGGTVTSTEHVPRLAVDRISTLRSEGDVVTTTTRTARSDLWVPTLTDGRDACVDWEAFLNPSS